MEILLVPLVLFGGLYVVYLVVRDNVKETQTYAKERDAKRITRFETILLAKLEQKLGHEYITPDDARAMALIQIRTGRISRKEVEGYGPDFLDWLMQKNLKP